MVNVLLITNILLVVSYVGITIWRMKTLPESISAMVYELPKDRQWVWSAWLCLVSVTLFEPLVLRVEFVGWLATVGLLGAALTPLIDLEKRRWHYCLAIGAGVLSQVTVLLVSPLWLSAWLVLLLVTGGMYVHPQGRLARAIEGRGVFIAECICWVALVGCLMCN